MRPHRLRLTAFGPFAGTVEVDLDALAASGLFLLHGETGAGKTTLLDGLGFALFGQVPGARGQVKRLRSDHAASDTRTAVQLEATLSGRRLRITRSPEQERAKLRGRGVTPAPAKVLLEEHDGGGWRTVSARAREADAELADLVGMSAEQFFQVVLLPQGEFARFLRAGSDERAALLERLFGTDRFRAVEQWLAERRRSTAAGREAAAEVVARLVARVAQVAGVDAPEQSEDGWGEALAADAAVQAGAARDEALRQQAALDQVLAADEQARSLADRQGRRRAALAEQDRLHRQLEAVTAVEGEAEAASRAAEAAGALLDARTRLGALAQARAVERKARATLAPPWRHADVDELRTQREAIGARLGRLDVLRADAERAERADEAAARARTRAQASARQVEQLGAALAAHPAALRPADQRRAAAKDARVRLPAVRAQAQLCGQQVRDAEALAETGGELAARREQQLAAREGAAAAREHAQQLREDRFEGMIGELAATLVDGDPCPVCGALAHPDPSELRGQRVRREDEQAASAEADRLRSVAEQLGEQVAAVTARREELSARLAATDRTELTEQAADLERQAAALSELADGLALAETDLARIEKDGAELRTRLATAQSEQLVAQAELAAGLASASAARAAVTAQLAGAPDLASAVAAAGRSASAVAAALAAAEQTQTAAQESSRAERAGELAATAAGFPDVAAATAAQRSAPWRAEAALRVSAHRDGMLAVRAVLADPELDVALEPRADPAATLALLEPARHDHAVAAGEAGRLTDRARQLADLCPQLRTANRQLGPLAARAAHVKALADLAAGQGANTLRMTLSAYVLAARLEEVAAVASERLQRMTQGRYCLVHTDTGRGGAKAGLGLLARDSWTGQDRHTSTLSGGETFLASLALALGLADVVAQEAGGARTEALFVDEGFGSLDEDTLEEVMDVLDGLREGGRLVGVVSHVAELRHRIPAQVHVRMGRAGSELSLVGC